MSERIGSKNEVAGGTGGPEDTLRHIREVNRLMHAVVNLLLDRADAHDRSKLYEPELSAYAALSTRLDGVAYGSPEYREAIKEAKPAVDHHYSKNRHHPEFHKNGLDDMTLFDLVEMLVDWKASSARTENGNLRKSLQIQKERTGMSDQLARIFENTIREHF